jgi:uncharacterized membrane protein YtjA (UPF0391 family)
MNDSLSFLADVDRLCGQFATALHNTGWQIYATLTLLIVLSALLFPPRDDPDQVWTSAEPARPSRSLHIETATRSTSMLSLVVTLLIIALIAAVLGFGGIAGAAVGIAKIVFFVALVLFIISLIAGGMRGGFGRRL